jgi:hypothetical protein
MTTESYSLEEITQYRTREAQAHAGAIIFLSAIATGAAMTAVANHWPAPAEVGLIAATTVPAYALGKRVINHLLWRNAEKPADIEQLKEPFELKHARASAMATNWLKKGVIAVGTTCALLVGGQTVYDSVADNPVGADIAVEGLMFGFTAVGGGLLELEERREQKKLNKLLITTPASY